ncbi:GlcG/HbpS family heme-binding protein [Kitasatospora brasiliensis]|uniref:GlcG/HbpS family heme-binding protein n=1 Tax=Kitasatospora brasiliensis TaxID=3058040 RepID=UPI00292D8279|nr:heme-binding protein [Kitasatospora sp. K002]
MSNVVRRASISSELAQKIIEAAATAALATDKRFGISVVDESGHLKAFLRQDGAKLITLQVSQDKAYTAAASQLSTEQWSENLKKDEVVGNGAPTGISRLVALGGGLPIVVDGEIVGAIGVSGGHWTDDVKIAEAGLSVLG